MPSKATIKIMVVSQLLGHLSAFNRLVHSGFLVMCCQTTSECSSMYYGHEFGMYIFTYNLLPLQMSFLINLMILN